MPCRTDFGCTLFVSAARVACVSFIGAQQILVTGSSKSRNLPKTPAAVPQLSLCLIGHADKFRKRQSYVVE